MHYTLYLEKGDLILIATILWHYPKKISTIGTLMSYILQKCNKPHFVVHDRVNNGECVVREVI